MLGLKKGPTQYSSEECDDAFLRTKTGKRSRSNLGKSLFVTLCHFREKTLTEECTNVMNAMCILGQAEKRTIFHSDSLYNQCKWKSSWPEVAEFPHLHLRSALFFALWEWDCLPWKGKGKPSKAENNSWFLARYAGKWVTRMIIPFSVLIRLSSCSKNRESKKVKWTLISHFGTIPDVTTISPYL